jgi:hypothetical protein
MNKKLKFIFIIYIILIINIMVFMLPIIIDSGKTILQVLEDYRDIDHNNYKQYFKHEK